MNRYYHVFIPGLFAPLRLWQQDFAFAPESVALMRLLASYQCAETPIRGVERSLLHWSGLNVTQQFPWAQLRHAFESGGMYQPPLLCADPVSLQSGSNGIMLQPEAPRLTREETELLFADLNEHLVQDGLVLKAFYPQRWYLYRLDERFNQPLPVTTPLSEVGSGNIFPALPQSSDHSAGDNGDKYWHQLLNEIQMLLHNHAVNQAREKRGQLPVNGVWFWGEGAVDTADVQRVDSVQGGDMIGQTLAHITQARWQQVDTTPAFEFESGGESGTGETLVILDQLQSAVAAEQPELWQQTLSGLSEYFEFLRAVLQAGGGVSLYDTAGNVLICEKVPGWQFWRRQQAEWREFI